MKPLQESKVVRVVDDEGSESSGLFVAVQEHENDVAEVVLVSEPEGASLTMGGLHPRASLYERPVNLDQSKKQHGHFREVLESYGIKVLTVKEILASGAGAHLNARIELEDLAIQALTYTLHPSYKLEDLFEEDRYYLSINYKRKVLEEMSANQLIDVLMLNPTVELTPIGRNTGFEAKYEYEPLSNLIYTRDQQITTAKGVVMGRLHSNQRRREVELLSYCFRKIGISVLGSVKEPGFLEGGDFFAAGPDLCFVGIGLRSNWEACHQLMKQDMFGTKSVAIVKDLFDQSQDRMHLDCVFNIVGYDCCLMLEDILNTTSNRRRLVDEYAKDPKTGEYKRIVQDIEFGDYVQSKGFKIIPVSSEDQVKYGCNVLNLGHGRILSVNESSGRKILRSPSFQGHVQVIEFSSITSMYGAVHCSSQVLKRRSEGKPSSHPSFCTLCSVSSSVTPRDEN